MSFTARKNVALLREFAPRPADSGARRRIHLRFLRSLGYRGLPLPDVPFDERRCVAPNEVNLLAYPRGNGVVPRRR